MIWKDDRGNGYDDFYNEISSQSFKFHYYSRKQRKQKKNEERKQKVRKRRNGNHTFILPLHKLVFCYRQSLTINHVYERGSVGNFKDIVQFCYCWIWIIERFLFIFAKSTKSQSFLRFKSNLTIYYSSRRNISYWNCAKLFIYANGSSSGHRPCYPVRDSDSAA